MILLGKVGEQIVFFVAFCQKTLIKINAAYVDLSRQAFISY